jgi:CRISPR-associated protein Csx16
MTAIFISRHQGARDWAIAEGFAVDVWVDHLELDRIVPGDRVMGTLPVHLAASVCARGACYYHLSLDLPEDWRGRELTAEDLRRYGARLEAYEVRPVAATALAAA